MSLSTTRPPSHEIVLTVRLSPGTLADTIKQLVKTITHVPITVIDEPTSTADDPDPPGIRSTADPPTEATTARAAQSVAPDPGVSLVPELPDHLQQRYYLGKLCKRAHRYEDLDYSVRKRSNHGCAICNESYVLNPKARRNGHTVTLDRGPVQAEVLRPELPKHLQSTCFLSPIACENDAHRFRGSLFTMRFLDSEGCVLCTTTTHALAGD